MEQSVLYNTGIIQKRLPSFEMLINIWNLQTVDFLRELEDKLNNIKWHVKDFYQKFRQKIDECCASKMERQYTAE